MLMDKDKEFERFLEKNPGCIKERDKRGCTLLHFAASFSRTDMARCLLEHGADPNAEDNNGFRPLHDAVSSHSHEVAQMLIMAGAYVNATAGGEMRITPAFVAKNTSDAQMIKMLQKHGGVESVSAQI